MMTEGPLNGKKSWIRTTLRSTSTVRPGLAKDHYIHQKAPRHQGKQTKQRKKQLVQQCQKPWQAPNHRWEPHRSGFHCSACGLRAH